jgi:hypothetical protein
MRGRPSITSAFSRSETIHLPILVFDPESQFLFLVLPTLKSSFICKDLRFSIVLSPSRSPLLLVQERGREGEMPIIETLEPRAPEELQLKIFATKTGEDYLIIQAVSEHVLLPFSPFCTPSSSPGTLISQPPLLPQPHTPISLPITDVKSVQERNDNQCQYKIVG